MKKLLIFLSLLAVLVSGYFAYQKWLASNEANPWQFVPSKSSVVFENVNPFGTLDSISNEGVWSAFSGMEAFQKLEEQLEHLDSANKEESLKEIFTQSQSLVAVFPTSADDLDVLIILKISSNQQRQYLQKAFQSFQDAGSRRKKRQYNGFTIEELYSTTNQRVFSFVRHENVLVASFTPFLVEDAIRAFNESEKLGFTANNPEAFRLTSLTQDHGNVYLNNVEFCNLINVFLKEGFDEFSGSGLLDIAFFQRHLKLSGFTIPREGLMSTFDSSPTGFNLLEIVPNNTALLRHYSMSGAEGWRGNLKRIDTSIESATEVLKSEYDVDADYFSSLLGNEFGNIQLEMVSAKNPDNLLLFNTLNIGQCLEFLSQTASRMASDSIFTDRVGDYVIGKLDDPRFTQAIFGEQSQLNGECYFTTHQSNLIFSNSVTEIKKLINSISEDNTWKKSIRVNQLLDLSSQEANMSVIMNVPRSWKYLMNSLRPEWVEVARQNEVGFKSLEYVAVQFNLVDNKFYTTAVAYQPQAPKQPAKTSIAGRTSFSSKIITKPFIVRSHVNQALEVLLQDSSFTVYHLSNAFEILWAKRLQEKIVGSIAPVDFYNNGKIQYAFVTKSKLHIIDRTGTYIDGYPKTIRSSSGVSFFSVVDYDGSKNYRFMITDDVGNILLMNKDGQPLGGWDPRKSEKKQIAEPTHIRAAGKDAFVAIQKNSVDLLSRRGTSYPGFPISFEENLVASKFIEPTGSFETSTITVITDGGELVRVNFSGQIEHREQLYKPELEVTFDIIPDVLNNTFLITRSSVNQWEVLDATGLKLFEKPYLNGASAEIQFYLFGGDKALIMAASSEDDFLNVYDLEGKVLTQRPMKASNPASVIFYENQNAYQFYLTSDNILDKVRID